MPFGSGRLLPAGTLREPPGAIERADMILFTRWNQRSGGDADRREVERVAGGRNIVQTSHSYVGLVGPRGRADDSGKTGSAAALLLSGIANPRSFERTVSCAGHKVLGHMAFADHHRYSDDDVQMAASKARELGAAVILTTEKDAVRLPESMWNLGIPVRCVRVDLTIEKGLGALREALESLLN
jgi:tetraacyldisaccharide 4'-kinase